MDFRNTLPSAGLPAVEGVDALVVAAERLNQASDAEQVLCHAVQVAAQLLSVDRVAIATNEGDHALRRYTWDEDDWHRASVRLPLDGSIAGWVIRHAQPFRCNNLATDGRLGGRYKYNTVLSVPIIAYDDGVLGALNPHERRGRAGFSQEDEQIAQYIAHQAAVALQRCEVVEQLRSSEARSRSLERNAAGVVAIVDATGVLQYVSANAGRVLGVDGQAACGRSLPDLVAPEDAARVRRVFQRFRDRGYVGGRLRLQLPVRSGRWRDDEVIASNQFDDPGVRGIVLNLHDITEFTRVKRDLEDRTRQLEAKAAEQEGFVREVSHALKSPLASIVAMSEVLEQDSADLGSEWQDGLSLIRRVSGRMESIINDLLTLARTSSGLDDLDLRPVPLDVVLDTVVHELAAQLSGRAADLTIEGPLPVVLGHGGRLAEAFSNLIDNAIKYTPANRQPRIRVGARTNGPSVQCWVADNGIGIPQDQRQRVFELFRRLDAARELQISGSGVGLAVVARIVERLGGRIWVEDSAQGGACFWLSLQAAPPGAEYPVQWVRGG